MEEMTTGTYTDLKKSIQILKPVYSSKGKPTNQKETVVCESDDKYRERTNTGKAST